MKSVAGQLLLALDGHRVGFLQITDNHDVLVVQGIGRPRIVEAPHDDDLLIYHHQLVVELVYPADVRDEVQLDPCLKKFLGGCPGLVSLPAVPDAKSTIPGTALSKAIAFLMMEAEATGKSTAADEGEEQGGMPRGDISSDSRPGSKEKPKRLEQVNSGTM